MQVGISFSVDGSNYANYAERNASRSFLGNSDSSTIVRHEHNPVWARYYRFTTLSWSVTSALRVELYGYPQAQPADLSGGRHPGFLGPLFLDG